MNVRGFIKGLCVLGVAAIITSCGKPEQTTPEGPGRRPTPRPSKPHIALIMKAISNPFFKTMADGATSAAIRLNVTLSCRSVTRETDFEEQARLVEQMVAQGVGAIIVAPADSKAIVTPLLEAQRRRIPIINIDNRIDTATAQAAGLRVLTFIGPDNAAGAEKSTDHLIQAVGGKGRIAMLEGIRGVNNAEQRKVGFRRAVAKTNGAVSIATMDTAEWATDLAKTKMEGILARYPDLAGVFCANDNMAFGAIAAIESAGRTGKVLVAAYDNLAAAQENIRAGRMVCTIEQHPDLMGALGVENALKAIRGEPIAAEIAVPTDLITSETLRKAKPQQ